MTGSGFVMQPLICLHRQREIGDFTDEIRLPRHAFQLFYTHGDLSPPTTPVASEPQTREDDLPMSVVDGDESFLTIDVAESVMSEGELRDSQHFEQEVHVAAKVMGQAVETILATIDYRTCDNSIDGGVCLCSSEDFVPKQKDSGRSAIHGDRKQTVVHNSSVF
ncbi:hypothetical protein BGX23_012299 [Mortierella sp. AD031]|nr:hypothetical protein BGX23_012299 [Mortierella sp. AD031]KAG0211262.1 hypothetical protein BGX33_004414 [Mortierella sp. NVP41]